MCARLGCWRDRGRGRHVWPAGLHADPRGRGLQAHGQASPRVPPPPISSSPSPICCARRAWSASSSSSTAPALATFHWPNQATHKHQGVTEYGATCGFFPIDQVTGDYLRLTGRDPQRVALVEAYAKAQGMWLHDGMEDPVFTAALEDDLGTVVPSLAGPRQPQSQVSLEDVPRSFKEALPGLAGNARPRQRQRPSIDYSLCHGDVVIAAITSCTNTSRNRRDARRGPRGRKTAVGEGLEPKPWLRAPADPGLRGGHRTIRKAGSGRVRPDWVQSRRLWLHGTTPSTPAAAGRDRRCRNRGPAHHGAVLSGNHNFKAAFHPAGQGQLSGIAASGSWPTLSPAR